jgi:hypothetical protein
MTTDTVTVTELRALARQVGLTKHEVLAAQHQHQLNVAAYNAKVAQLAQEDPEEARMWPTYEA